MGVIRRQSLKHTAVNLVGLGVGAVSTLFVYPHALEAYGLAQVLLSVGMVGLPVLSLGANTVAIRFFPRFQDKSSGHHGFLPLLMTLCLVGFIISGLTAWLFWAPFSAFLESKSPLLHEYLWMGFPLAFFYVASSVLAVYSANFKRIVVPSLLLDFSQKLALPLLLIAVWQEWLTLAAAMWGMLLHAALVTLGLVIYLRSIGEWHWRPDRSFVGPALRKELLQFILFGALGGFALLVAAKADLFMVGSMSAVKAAGVYAIAAYLAAIIEVPTKSLYAASASSVAQYLADDDRPALEKLYKSVSINLLVAGLLLFGGLWISIDLLFALLPNGNLLSEGKWVFLFIGLARIMEMATGLNNYMVYYSQYYRYSLLSLGVLAASNVALNIWLIPLMGITGAALATFLSITGYNAISVGLVWLKFRLFPFTLQTLKAIGFALFVYVIVSQVFSTGYPVLDLALRSGLYGVFFAGSVLYFRVSDDLNHLKDVLFYRLSAFFGRIK
ncbi:MAG: polysaccharide biosynthesis C-terminal domain-containing protein [Saprospiraceae bacterium]|nr:polysaccharide biosynthesis C-terminal domain-containing protein [Saprospiraceae bacterium]